MQLSTEHINSFRNLYREKFGIDLTVQQAQEQALKLIRLVQLTYKPITKQQYHKAQLHKKELQKTKESNWGIRP
jgi:hypothetical protein